MMKKRITIVLLLIIAYGSFMNLVWAVPAYPGWIEMQQPDSSIIELRLIGDEFYSYWINRDGKEMEQNEDGWWVEKKDTVTPARRRQIHQNERNRRSSVAPEKKASKPKKVLVILVNYKDKAMQTKHSHTFFDDMLNKEDSLSVKEYFIQSSDGNYSPQFDVFGPVTLDSAMAYYGANKDGVKGSDIRPGYMIVEACKKAHDLGCNFADYDENGDGYVDNVNVIYAGFAEASGAAANTIWPHKWDIYSANGLSLKLDGKYVFGYSCSAELRGYSGTNSAGIGTFCHEFSHILGMPDYYDTNYGDNYTNEATPGVWSLMDAGNYNNYGQKPPLYSIFDKLFMGWATMPELLPKDANTTVTMPAGTQYTKHINGTTKASKYTSTSTVYYLENRPNTGWFDSGLPYGGMLIWSVTYKSQWSTPNNVSGVLRYTLLSATGSTTGLGTRKDCYPGYNNVTSKVVMEGCSLNYISKKDNVISFKFNEGTPTEPIQRLDTFYIVEGQSYSWYGQTLTTPGTYHATSESVFGDTAITLTLKWADPFKTVIYTGPNKLAEATSYTKSGLHIYSFGQPVKEHHFSNNIGIAVFKDTVRTLGRSAFYGCRKGLNNQILTVEVPATVTEIGPCAFYCCYELQRVNVPDAVTHLGDSAFYKCQNLTGIQIPEGIDTIGDRTFLQNYKLTQITLPESLKLLGKNVFYNCTTLVELTSKALTPPETNSTTFSGLTSANVTLYVWPIALTEYDSTSYWNNFTNLRRIDCGSGAIEDVTQDTIFEGDSLLWRDKIYKQEGIYADTTTTDRYGCDTTIYILELTVKSHPTGWIHHREDSSQREGTRKVLYRDQLYIERNGVLYNVLGY